jgi:hypothetical protein
MDCVVAHHRASGRQSFHPVGTKEKLGFDAATGDGFDEFQSLLKINMITVQGNVIEMAWAIENHFGTEPTSKRLTASRHSPGTTPGIC